MTVVATSIPGCYMLKETAWRDERGSFLKVIDAQAMVDFGLNVGFMEQYYTVSGPGVLRGLHFQLPPHGHDKVVYCVTGRVFDAVLDLRAGSPTFGRSETFELHAESGSLYIPEGLAHGFQVLDAPATLVYNVTSAHAPTHDTGVRWDSAGIDWPNPKPIISARDASFQALSDFSTPFKYDLRRP